jgi:hypothetical protein
MPLLRSTEKTTSERRRYELLDRALERRLLPDALLQAGSLYGAWDRERRESAGGSRTSRHASVP